MPVLLIAFRSPENLRLRIRELNSLKFNKIFVFIDRYSGDDLALKKANLECFEIVRDAQKNGVIHSYLFAQKNMGQSKGIPTAISWFLDLNEAGLIVEDDCKVHPEILKFIEAALPYYENEMNFAAVCSTVLTENLGSSNFGLISSPFFECWVWYVDKKRWHQIMNLDINIENLNHSVDAINSLNLLQRFTLKRYFANKYMELNDSEKATWAIRFTAGTIQLGMRCIYPPINMSLHIPNVGATHVRRTPRWYRNINIDKKLLSRLEDSPSESRHFNSQLINKMYGATLSRYMTSFIINLKNWIYNFLSGKFQANI